MIMYLKPERIRRETEKAYLLQCPESSYSYAKAGFWMSKSQVKLCRYGNYAYLQVNFPATGMTELKRYISRRQSPQVFRVEWLEIQAMFRVEHELVWLRIEQEHRNQAADRQFEQTMRGF